MYRVYDRNTQTGNSPRLPAGVRPRQTMIGPIPRPWPDPAISPFLPYRTVLRRSLPDAALALPTFFHSSLILTLLVEIPCGILVVCAVLCLLCGAAVLV